MGYVSALNLIDAVTVIRDTVEPDGMGGYSTTTLTTVLGKAALWSIDGRRQTLSDQVAAVSSHILACLPSDDVEFGDRVSYGSKSYEVSGHADDVLNKAIVKIVPLREVT
jgi:hypothetical protein